MTIADLAIANAIPLEVKKDGLQQRQNGDWVLRLVIQAADMDQRITQAAMGTRFMAALVEVNEDETPTVKPEKPAEAPAPAKAKKDWRDLLPSQQAAIRCGEPIFWAFLREVHHYEPANAVDAAGAVRKVCNVESRTAFNSDQRARVLWHQLDSQFQAWKVAEGVRA